jgi:hypothetical protein
MSLGIAALQSRLKTVEIGFKARAVQNIKLLDNYSFQLFDENGEPTKRYIPSKTGIKFHQSNHFVRLIMGPFNSGKSTINAADIVMRACAMPACIDGVRRCKVVVIRNTSGELETSTLVTWEGWFGDLGSIRKRKKPVLTWEHTFNDGNGPIELTLVFLACDRPDDMKKLKSTEFTLAYLNEANELPSGLLDYIKGRVNGRWPSKADCPDHYFTGVLMDTNPPDDEHELYRIFEITKPDDYIIFKQPPGLLVDPDNPKNYLPNPECDNYEHMRADYYTKMAQGADAEFIKIYCMGMYGLIKRGEPVYPQYNDTLHAVDKIELEEGYAIYLGWDFGNTPACLISQDINGQFRSIKEFVSTFNTSVQELAENRVKPWLDQFCQGFEIYGWHDPSDPDASSTGIAPSQTIEAAGIPSEPAISNLLQPRLDAVKHYLNKMVNGKPAYQVSIEGCPTLRAGMYGKYIYRLVHKYGEQTPAKEPIKTHPISDIQDAQQYICLGLHNVLPVSKNDSSRFLIPANQRGFI